MKYRNIFSGVTVTVNRIMNGLVHYRRDHPVDWQYNYQGSKLSDRSFTEFIKPSDYFDRCYERVDKKSGNSLQSA